MLGGATCGGCKGGDTLAQPVSHSSASGNISARIGELLVGFMGNLRLGLGAALFLGSVAGGCGEGFAVGVGLLRGSRGAFGGEVRLQPEVSRVLPAERGEQGNRQRDLRGAEVAGEEGEDHENMPIAISSFLNPLPDTIGIDPAPNVSVTDGVP